MENFQRNIQTRECKSNELAEKFRNEGNKKFREKNFFEALSLYNKSLCYSQDMEILSLGYANRSAVYKEVKMFDMCIENIHLAKENGYPSNKMNKLIEREQNCKKIVNLKMKSAKEDAENFFKLSLPANEKIPFAVKCLKYQVNEKYGRHVITTANLKAGDIILIEEPFLKKFQYGTQNYYTRCANCLKTNKLNLIPCNICATTMYCSSECQRNDELVHPLECKVQTTEKIFLSNLKLVLQAVQIAGSINNLKRIFKDKSNSTVFDFDWSKEDLSHSKNFLSVLASMNCVQTSLLNEEKLDLLKNVLKKYLADHLSKFNETYKIDDQTDFLCQQSKNFFNIFNTNSIRMEEHTYEFNQDSAFTSWIDYNKIGSGIFPFASLFNHSCDPNTTRVTVDNKLVFVIRKPVKSGEQIFVTYGPDFTGYTLMERQNLLIRDYGFKCDCEACRNDYPKMETFVINPSIFHKSLSVAKAKKEFRKGCVYMEKHMKDHPSFETDEMMYLIKHTLFEIAKLPFDDKLGSTEPFFSDFRLHSSPGKNDDMTENSDSGFTEFNQTRSSDTSQHEMSKTSSPEPDNQEQRESSSDIVELKSSDNSLGRGSMSKSSESSSDDDDSDDDDYEDSEASQTSVLGWVRQQMQKGANPRDIIKVLLHNFHIPENMSETMLWRIISFAVTPQRERLSNVKTLSDAVHRIRQAKHIIILTGAGVSVSCGIPDFRSRDGVYSRLSREYPNLPDPQAMFDIKFFYQDPRPFFKFAREIFPGQFKPSPSHRFIKKMEERGVLLRNYTQNIDTLERYTQNIDTLERVAGISRLIECHGSFATASCTRCKFKINGDAIREDILQQRIPICFLCNPNHGSQTISPQLNEDTSTTDRDHLKNLVEMGIFKPDIVFFGEELPDDFHDSIDTDRNKCDLLIVIGSSLKVKPVAMIPNLVPPNVPQILINREPLSHMNFDVNLYGDSDVIIHHLYSLLSESDDDKDEELCWMEKTLEETTVEIPQKTIPPSSPIAPENEPATSDEPQPSLQSPNSESLVHLLPADKFAQISPRCYMFPGAEVTLENMEGESEDSDDEYSDEDDEDEAETSPNTHEIIVPDIDNVLSNEIPIPEVSPTPTTSNSLSPTPSTSSQLQCNDREVIENITNMQADEATEENFEATPIKRPRLEIDDLQIEKYF
ncbi:CLUMA_CG018942, isoform A [Clunio marinus]|uniref:protein acetyllysine N-acetyltransferase n=1 Tax=Clunio marinus TaxID=568069 RepID=A0A1J1J199_9DIPT|nr:CLUMA_CG018942, isoform A [Clunio marinus]